MTFIFADESNPLEINTSTSFIDNEFGADIQGQVNDAFFGFVPSLAYDTWLTIGDSYSSAAQTTPGFDLSSGFSGSSLSLGGSVNSDIAVFRTPDDPFVFLILMVTFYLVSLLPLEFFQDILI